MKKNMQENFRLLFDRVMDTNNISDIRTIKEQLAYVQESVICVGSGGSGVVSEFASKVFIEKNQCIAATMDPRDLLYDKSISLFKELFICSYSGKNYGVEIALKSKINQNLFTNNSDLTERVNIINYQSSLEKEKSFISLGATLIPISILLNYYLEGKSFEQLMYTLLNNHDFSYSLNNNINFEIMSGYDTSVAARYLESTLVEAGLGIASIHNKYDYCHGRTTLAHHHKAHTLIYLKTKDTELDQLILNEVQNLYDNIILLESNHQDLLIDNFNLLVQSMYLTKAIAEAQNKDLSGVDYAPAVKKLYYFKGGM